jgi:hypothetical protein
MEKILVATHGLKIVTSLCGSGTCPTIYESDRGTLIIQGYPVDAAHAGVVVPEGESLVEIPAELLAKLSRSN